MAKLTFDLSGIGGLVERHQGDLNDSAPKQHLRYIGADNQMADGIYNPIKRYGYMAPANNSFETITGVIYSPTKSMQYDSESDIVYICSSDELIDKLDGLDDTSVSNYITLAAGNRLKDMLIYEVNGNKSLIYISDGGTLSGLSVGFATIDTSRGMSILDNQVVSSGLSTQDAVLTDASGATLKIAQNFYVPGVASPITGLDISGVRLRLRRSVSNISFNVKVSIQANTSASTSPYTARGAWTTTTSYVINDTVTSGGNTYQCYSDHTSGATTEPGVGALWESRWDPFGSPSGTALVTSSDVSSDTLEETTSGYYDVYFTFPTIYTLTSGEMYWFVLEESGSAMTTTETVTVAVADNGDSLYTNNIGAKKLTNAATDYWQRVDHVADEFADLDFTLILNRDDDWSSTTALGHFTIDSGQSSYLYLADNGVVYWFVGNRIHTIDGSITAGNIGKVSQNVIAFPDYITIPDVTETRSRMYIAIQSAEIGTIRDTRTYNSFRSGIIVWDRRSQVTSNTDLYPTPGAREIKNVFTSSDGSVKVITVGNAGFSEIREASGNQFAVTHTFEKDGYPSSRRAISQVGDMTFWMGANGIFYAYGSPAPGEKIGLFKIGTSQDTIGSTAVPNAILVGNKNSTERLAVLFGFRY